MNGTNVFRCVLVSVRKGPLAVVLCCADSGNHFPKFQKLERAYDFAAPLAFPEVAEPGNMSGKSPNAANTILHPDNIKPVERPIQIAGQKFEHAFEPIL